MQVSRHRNVSFAGLTLLLAVLILAFVGLSQLSGCSSLGLAQPKSFDEQLANAYGVHTAVLSAGASAVATGALTAAQGQYIETQGQSARALLDAARIAETSNPSGAQSDLTLALSGLTALQSYLNAHAGGPAIAGGK